MTRPSGHMSENRAARATAALAAARLTLVDAGDLTLPFSHHIWLACKATRVKYTMCRKQTNTYVLLLTAQPDERLSGYVLQPLPEI